ncbi:alanine racemase [Helicovermis profundi]|uniref:Alanine racemase n=1 Tax=Helicovermis profundi TaxID=3065157 RepID=A0AAU9E4Q2_9FIRM|nr:alanine racemase [Clostridia bacterium S502]
MKINNLTRPVWAEINLDNLANNIREVKRSVKEGTIVTAVIKADGYGHGAIEIADTLLENGADRFAVATLSEAIQLRSKFKDIEILLLGYTPTYSAKDVIINNITQTVYSLSQAIDFSVSAKELNKKVKLHIKLDTGMNRLGMEISEKTVEEIEKISKLTNVEIEGIFTHFAVADEENKEYTYRQVEKYNFIIEELEKREIFIPIKHVSNSAAIIDMKDLNFNMVRAGIMLYGLYPSNDVIKKNVNLKEVMSLKAQLSHVKEVEENTGISYGLIYKTDSKKKIGTLPLGYADGFTRMYTGKAKGIVDGKIMPIVGRICMDQCMIDLTGTSAKVGDEVILFGKKEGNEVTIDEVSKYIGTINYEVVCMINKRVPRVYIEHGKVKKIRDYILDLI